MDINLSPFKRRYVDNWRKDVNRHLRAGTICKIVTETLLPGEKHETKDILQNTLAAEPVIHSSEIATETSPRVLAIAHTDEHSSIGRLKFINSKFDGNRNKSIPKKNSEGMCNGVQKEEHRPYTYSKPSDPIHEEKVPMVIIDPQLITPSQKYENTKTEKKSSFRPKSTERNSNPFKFTSIQNQQEIKPERNGELWSIRCQMQSRDKNSFVVSRSNVIKYNSTNVTNHSFLNLPARFQTVKQTQNQNQQQTNFKPEVSLDKISSRIQPQRRNITAMFAVQAW